MAQGTDAADARGDVAYLDVIPSPEEALKEPIRLDDFEQRLLDLSVLDRGQDIPVSLNPC